jgi:NAD+ synthase (glutamine-hydrolysing)
MFIEEVVHIDFDLRYEYFLIGCSSLCLNGQIVGRTAQYGIEEVEVATATIDLEDIRSYRNSVRSRNIKAASAPSFPRIDVTGFALSGPRDVSVAPSKGQFRLIF